MKKYDSLDFQAGSRIAGVFAKLFPLLEREPTSLVRGAPFAIELVFSERIAQAFIHRERSGLGHLSQLVDTFIDLALKGRFKFDKAHYFEERGEQKKLEVAYRRAYDSKKLSRERSKAVGMAFRWYESLRNACLLNEPIGDLVNPICELFAAGYQPLGWHGTYPEGHLVIYAPPTALALPSSWVAAVVTQGVADQPPRMPLDRAQFGEPSLPIEDSALWNEWLKLTPEKALMAAWSPLLAGADPWALPVLSALASRVERVQVQRGCLVFHADPKDGGSLKSITCRSPYTGSLSGLSPELARVVRRFNGIEVKADLPVEWFPYREKKGFELPEWEIWIPGDNYDGLWKKRPLVPMTDTSDIWLFHPLEREGNYLKFVRVDHEDAGLERPFTQHPFAEFVRLTAIHLGVEVPT